MAKSSQKVKQSDSILPVKLTDRQMGYLLLREQGVAPKDASKSVGYNEVYGYQLDKKLSKYSLKDKKMVKMAHQAVKSTLKMEPIEITHEKRTKSGEVVEYKEKLIPSFTNRLTAAQMIYDRVEPIKSESSGPITNNYVQVNINKYKSAPQDVVNVTNSNHDKCLIISTVDSDNHD